MSLVLGIETSCDETSVCLLKSAGQKQFPVIIGEKTYSQIDIYKEWGGVVPEIASRNHLLKLWPLLESLLQETNIKLESLDAIGVTCFPGLLGPLLTGLNLAKTISLYHKIPLFPANHLLAHIEAIHLTEKIPYPYIGAILSGGHSLFVKVISSAEFEVLASTIDDAAGEAFDKGGKLMGLPYPSGQIIDEKAKKGDRSKFSFPIGLYKEKKNPNMSFSGLKTSLRNLITKNPDLLQSEESMQDLCASYQEAIAQSILEKLQVLFKKTEKLPLVIGGGVACNSRLRETLKENFTETFFVSPKFCTDNAVMIANLTLRNLKNIPPYPRSLKIDAKSRLINKKEFL